MQLMGIGMDWIRWLTFADCRPKRAESREIVKPIPHATTKLHPQSLAFRDPILTRNRSVTGSPNTQIPQILLKAKPGIPTPPGLVGGGIHFGTIQSGGVHSRHLEVQIVQLGHADGQRFPQRMAWHGRQESTTCRMDL